MSTLGITPRVIGPPARRDSSTGEQRGQVGVAVATLYRALDALADGGQQRELEIVAIGRLEDEPGVLAGQREREADGLEAALDHRAALEVGVGGPERAAGDRVQEGARVDVDRLGEVDGL